MQRRGFLAGILAAGFAPAIGHAGILMPVRRIITPREFWEDWKPGEMFISSGVTADGMQWQRVGNIVTISGKVQLTGKHFMQNVDLRTRQTVRYEL